MLVLKDAIGVDDRYVLDLGIAKRWGLVDRLLLSVTPIAWPDGVVPVSVRRAQRRATKEMT